MTADEQQELNTLAKAVTVPLSAPLPPALLRLYEPALALLVRAWDAALTCTMCPRRGNNHTCGCPHGQVRKWARQRGLWPLDQEAA